MNRPAILTPLERLFDRIIVASNQLLFVLRVMLRRTLALCLLLNPCRLRMHFRVRFEGVVVFENTRAHVVLPLTLRIRKVI